MALSIVSGSVEEERLARIEDFTGQKISKGGRLAPIESLKFLIPTYRTLLILSGRKDKLRKGDVLGALIKEGNIPSDAIGNIALSARSCAIAIHRNHVQNALLFLRSARVKKKRVRAIILET